MWTNTLGAKEERSYETRLEKLTISAPETIPAPPISATALPTTNATEVGAVADTIDLTSNMRDTPIKTHLMWNPA